MSDDDISCRFKKLLATSNDRLLCKINWPTIFRLMTALQEGCESVDDNLALKSLLSTKMLHEIQQTTSVRCQNFCSDFILRLTYFRRCDFGRMLDTRLPETI